MLKTKVEGVIGTLAEVVAPRRVAYFRPVVRTLGSAVNHILVENERAMLEALRHMEAKSINCTIINLEEKLRIRREVESRYANREIKEHSMD